MATATHPSPALSKLPIDSIKQFPNCYPDANPLDTYRSHISALLSQVSGVDEAILYPAIQWTTGLEKGDLIIAVPAMRIKGKNLEAKAVELAEKFPESPLIEKPRTAGHFLQFFCRTDVLAAYLIPLIRQRGPQYGQNRALGLRDPADDPAKGARRRIVIEFSSPNIAKPFHAGHLRGTIIGGFLANLYESSGWDVTTVNYLGDWGKQYGLLALGFERYGDETELVRDPIQHLFQLYVRINSELKDEKDQIDAIEARSGDATELRENGLDEQARRYFRKMTEGDPDALALWRRFRDLSIARYRDTYARLNIRFDAYAGESLVSEASMAETDRILAERGITEESEGAIMIDFSKHVAGKAGKSLEKALIRKRDGTALYLTREVSELLRRDREYQFDRMIYVVGDQQGLHLRQLFKIAELMGHGHVAARCEHISFGMVHGMSTRRGTVKFLDDIFRDVGEHMHEVMRKNEDKYQQVEDPAAVADTLGISSVMVQDMTGKRIHGYTFNMDAMTSFEGDTGPYLQYAHARLCSIARRVAAEGVAGPELDGADLSLLTEERATDLIRSLAQWPDVFANTVRTQEPTTVLTYLFRMTHTISASYDHLRIVGSEPGLMRARMALYDAARTVLANGMRLLGLTPVERM